MVMKGDPFLRPRLLASNTFIYTSPIPLVNQGLNRQTNPTITKCCKLTKEVERMKHDELYIKLKVQHDKGNSLEHVLEIVLLLEQPILRFNWSLSEIRF